MRTAQTQNPTRSKLLEASKALMLTKGFPATTIDEICRAAGLTKGSFFHYFKDKEDLAKAVLQSYADRMTQAAREAPFFRNPDPLQRIYGYIDFMIARSKDPEVQQGCLLGHFAQELSDTHPRIRSLCARQFDRWAGFLQSALDKAKALHAPRAALDTRSVANHFIAVVEGSLILARVQNDPDVIERNLKHFESYLKGILRPKK